MVYSIDYYEGKKDAHQDFIQLINDLSNMGAIDNDVKKMLNSYLDNNLKMFENQMGIIFDAMLDEKRGIYE